LAWRFSTVSLGSPSKVHTCGLLVKLRRLKNVSFEFCGLKLGFLFLGFQALHSQILHPLRFEEKQVNKKPLNRKEEDKAFQIFVCTFLLVIEKCRVAFMLLFSSYCLF
jgi:hypothetical protein